jgi:hypothetical protein
MASILAAAFARLVTVGTGLATVILAVLHDMVALTNFALAVRAGAFGGGLSAHTTNM